MGRIILPDDTGRFPSTFADDFYLPDLKNEHVKIVAQLPGWADVRWYLDLVRRAGHEVKSRWVVLNWRSLGADLRDAAERSIREALIVISDSSTAQREIQASIENRILKNRLTSLDSGPRRLADSFIDEHVDLGVLYDSPAFAAMDFAHGEPNMRKLRRKLGGPHNVRIFSARITAALVEYLDPERRRKVIDHLLDRRYVTHQQLTAHFLADAITPDRVFDEGNTKVVEIIRDMTDGVAGRIRNMETEMILLPAGSASISERDSSKAPLVAVADIAARMAGDLYVMESGLRRVVERFRMVILNGKVVRK